MLTDLVTLHETHVVLLDRDRVLIRPLTEGVQNWAPSWASLVRLRSAQWSAQIAADPQLRLVSHVFAPHNYRGSCCVASSAVVYQKL